MMKTHINLNSLLPPYLHLVAVPAKNFGDYAFKMAFEQRLLAIRVLRGDKMRSRQSLFNEFAAACQFPLYFGENWDALEECLADLSWIRAKGFGLMITKASEVLHDEVNEQYRIFLDVLSSISQERAHADVPDSFHVLLQCEPAELEATAKKFESISFEICTDL